MIDAPYGAYFVAYNKILASEFFPFSFNCLHADDRTKSFGGIWEFLVHHKNGSLHEMIAAWEFRSICVSIFDRIWLILN